MKKYSKKIFFLLLIIVLVALLISGAAELISFESLKKNGRALTAHVRENYLISVFTFAAAFLSTAFFVPGALILTVSGGFLFGAPFGALYASLFSTAGSTLAFLMSRHFLGSWVQQRFEKQLNQFNKEISRHGPNYVFVLRVLPVMPSFLVNYLAGLTRISTVRFAAATFLGICPGAIIYSFAGSQLSSIETLKDILSVKVTIAFLLLAVFALLPVLYDLIQRATRKS